jgi:subtilisin family serine protease
MTARRPRCLSHERLEHRRVLSADFSRLSNGAIGRIEWQGQEVEAYQDRWVVSYAAPAGGLASLGDLLVSGGLWGWSVVNVGGGYYQMTTPGAGTKDVAAWGATAAGIVSLEPDFALSRSLMPNDPSLSQLWGLHNTGQSGGVVDADIDAPEAWDVTTGSRSVVIGVIDSGVDVSHPDLAANIWRNPGEIPGNGIDDDNNGFIDDVSGWDFVSNDNVPQDGDGHGTHVAGTIGGVGNDGRGVTGVNWQVSLLPLKFLSDSGSGSTAAAIAAINYATALRARGVNIVATNNSWGGGGFSSALQDAIRRHGEAGILFVAAAGNESSNNDTVAAYPANYALPNVISVAALDRSDQLASFSNYGATKVHIGAPGVAIYSTTPGNRYASYNGTSMAAPHVAGVAGLLAAANPQATMAEMRAAILDSAVPIPALSGSATTGGRLNAAAALQRIAPVAGPRVLAVTPAGEIQPPVTSLQVVFSEGIAAAALVPGNFQLTGAGPDRSFGTVDDITVAIPAGGIAQLPAGTVTITLAAGLAEDAYRLRLMGTGSNPLRNAAGLPLQGGVNVDRTFTVRVVPPPPPAPGEPNDTLAAATVGLAAGVSQSAFSGVIGDGANDARDVDLFSVALAAGDSLAATVRAAATGSSLDSFLRVFNAAGQQLAFNDDAGGSLDSQVVFSATATGTYYVGVSGYGNSAYTPATGGGTAAGSTGPYEVTFRRSLPPLEPNDSLAQATVVTPVAGAARFDAVIGDGAYGSGDVDLFSVSLAAGQQLTADIATGTAGSSLDSYLRVFDATGRELASNDDFGGAVDSYLTYTAAAAGTFFVGVSGYGNSAYLPATAGTGRAGSTGMYRLDLGFSTVAPPPPAPDPAAVVGRHVFYNNSGFDGWNAVANSADDAAIATDKQALLRGQTAGFVNYTSYSRGLNGIMIDVARLAGTPQAVDFSFRVGPGFNGTWQTAAAPRSISVRPAAGVGGSSRITITWADGAIRGTWLEVTVRATAATGLAAADVFLFGNAIGEVGNSAVDAVVSMQDVDLIAANQAATAAIGSRYDINRDGRVNTVDRSLASLNRTTARTALPLLVAAAGAIETAAVPPTAFSESATRLAESRSNGRLTVADVFRLLAVGRSGTLSAEELRHVRSLADDDAG